ncbi:cellulase family glycosylhydrolase [Halalkalibacterium halodurans]|uniref:Endo-beta-1,4-glucanase (Celulase B) n=2 Tax=Halalkalibacterium halodurans TaxID=86665 RepID=Q9KF82_HALH5|nr:cellulase family glycosylhydrolase [Halalkalibacterium halodurans]MED4124536.1 cellulase family glycosylhydrolase [Halalkalibacterium halodurans]MED4173205.1 cellulase family glycosylhydrolase [Halalkalibacterium halodurans]BAB04322.1 endo-beta-1,4-glucanase (celulase B) [Halalkalibacterium halodurans C-125]
MKWMKSMAWLAVVLVVSFVAPAVSSAHEDVKTLDIQSYVRDMQPGWNLGNTFDAVGQDETAWGNPRVTRELIEQIADEGYKSIRIPVTWENRIGGAPDYPIDPQFLNRVDQVVQWALEEDLYVMINLHHDSWLWIYEMEHNYNGVMVKYRSLWEQLSNHFKDYPTKLMFESVNEPKFSQNWGEIRENHHALLDDLNTVFFEIVRQSGGQNDIRPLVLPTMETATSQPLLNNLYQTIDKLDDPNLIATVHYYGFWPFSVNIAGYTRFEENSKQEIIEAFDRVHHTFVARGIPVVLGEFGLLGFDKHTGVIQQGEKLKFFEFLIHHLNERDITHMLWDNGQHFNRHTYEWYDQELFDMMRASWEGRSSVAESNFIYLKQGDRIADATVSLQLHGNELTGLRANGQRLTPGQDYELNGERLTVKAHVLSAIASSGTLGTNGMVTAEFNRGADWHFRVNTYRTPVLQSTQGHVSNFSIPASFNGNSLATMEAVYVDGGNAGPQDWTSFKEFGYAFSPSYDANEMKLTEAFFREVRDGEVRLTFHFWSGETVNYTIIKNGNQVTGIAAQTTNSKNKNKK